MIDWTRAALLRSELGAEGFREVAELFLEEVEAMVTRCALSADRREEDMHFLKGSAWNLGFAALADFCQAGERAAAQGRGDSVDPAELRRIWDASRRDFLARVGPELGDPDFGSPAP